MLLSLLQAHRALGRLLNLLLSGINILVISTIEDIPLPPIILTLHMPYVLSFVLKIMTPLLLQTLIYLFKSRWFFTASFNNVLR